LYSGVIVFEDGKIIRLAANPLDKNAQMFEIEKEAILDQTESKVSIMPEGLLNTMTKPEILDLLAYLISGGEITRP
jgi:hypothetical protein